MATRDYRKLRWQSEHETRCQTLKIDKNFSPNLHIPAIEKKRNNKIKWNNSKKRRFRSLDRTRNSRRWEYIRSNLLLTLMENIFNQIQEKYNKSKVFTRLTYLVQQLFSHSFFNNFCMFLQTIQSFSLLKKLFINYHKHSTNNRIFLFNIPLTYIPQRLYNTIRYKKLLFHRFRAIFTTPSNLSNLKYN